MKNYDEKYLSFVRHELRNLLTPISGYTQLLKIKFKPKTKESKWLDEITKNLERMNTKITELLS